MATEVKTIEFLTCMEKGTRIGGVMPISSLALLFKPPIISYSPATLCYGQPMFSQASIQHLVHLASRQCPCLAFQLNCLLLLPQSPLLLSLLITDNFHLGKLRGTAKVCARHKCLRCRIERPKEPPVLLGFIPGCCCFPAHRCQNGVCQTSSTHVSLSQFLVY